MLLTKIFAIAFAIGTSIANEESDHDDQQRKPLYIGGYLQNAVWGFGAVDMCVRHLNELPGILDGYELRLRWNLTNRVTCWLYPQIRLLS